MTVRTTALGGTNWTDGEVLYGADLNDTIITAYPNVFQIYTGTGFDSFAESINGTDDTDTKYYELTAIPSTNLTNKNYVKIKIFISSESYSSGSEYCAAYSSIKLELKQIGGVYAELFNKKISTASSSSGGDSSTPTSTLEYLHTLTTDEKTNGIQFKITGFSSADSTGSGSSSSKIYNIQTVVELI